jgi:multiple antibiotic resistance protein
VDPESVGAVSLGVPLITGPAVLTTSILLLNEHSFLITAIAILVNILITGIVFFFSQYIIGFLGIASLLLAAIGVMIIRKGIEYFISSWI